MPSYRLGCLPSYFLQEYALLNDLAFKLIPFFDKFRAPETWLVITFSSAVLVAYGLDSLPEYKPEKFQWIPSEHPDDYCRGVHLQSCCVFQS